jgi:hypothetical protein
MCEGEVHVVTPEEEVFAHGDALEGEVAVLAGDSDKAEIGRASTDIADEQDVGRLNLFSPVGALVFQPSVEGGLRFLQECGFVDSG